MDFVIVSTADWDNPFWTNKQHVANTLADMGHRVLYIDSLGLRTPTVTKSDFARIAKRIRKLFAGTKMVRENVWVMSPFSVPLQKYSLIRWLNEKILVTSIKRKCKVLGFYDIILWTYNPMTEYLIGEFNERKSVYHCVDKISAQPGMPKELLIEKEKNLLKHVDIVFTTAITLNDEKSAYNNCCYYYSNVADYNHFHKAVTEKFNKPFDLPDDNKPILGFVGAISGYKQDFYLLEYVAQYYRDYHIVLIGKIGEGDPYTDTSILSKYKNIHFLGPKEYKALPQYIAFFDVAMLPCCINDYTNGMFPMKFFEYLAAGKQIVSTDIATLREFEGYYHCAKSYEDFVNKIDDALNSRIDIKVIDQIAKKYTYESRTNKMLDLLMKVL